MARTTVAYWQHVGTGEVFAVRVDADDQLVSARGRKRQDSERKRAVARVSRRGPLPDSPYAACSTAHTSAQRSWNRRR